MKPDQANNRFPILPLAGLGFLVLLAVAAVTVPDWLGGYTAGKTDAPAGQVLQSRNLQFVDVGNGNVEILDWDDGSLIREIPAGEENFIRGVIRGLVRERKTNSIGQEAAFRLSQYDNGNLILEDPATQRVLVLEAFGITNKQAFQQLLDDQRQTFVSR